MARARVDPAEAAQWASCEVTGDIASCTVRSLTMWLLYSR